jgi:ribosomal protein L3
MGHETVTTKNRSVVAIDTEKNVIAIKGPIAGPNGTAVFLTKEPSTK